MDKKVTSRQYAAIYHKGQQKIKKEGQAERGSFEKVLASKKSNAQTPNALPPFPYHKARPQTITVDQAKKLARYAPLIKNAAIQHHVPIELICGVILQESGGNPRAISPAGARGLMQLMPQTARRFGLTNSFDPAQNIDGGTKYLRWLLDRYNGNVELTLAAFNAGEQNVDKHGLRVPPFLETQNYVPNVLGYARAMIDMLRPATPPSTSAMQDKLA